MYPWGLSSAKAKETKGKNKKKNQRVQLNAQLRSEFIMEDSLIPGLMNLFDEFLPFYTIQIPSTNLYLSDVTLHVC